MIAKAIQFLSEVKGEVKKVTWPSKKEALGGTAVVLLVVFFDEASHAHHHDTPESIN